MQRMLPSSQQLSVQVGKVYGEDCFLDYMIWPRRWGIEVLRDGHGLKEHLARFEEGGRYMGLIETAQITDWCVLDMRNPTTRLPSQPQQGVTYARFTPEFRTVEILNDDVTTYMPLHDFDA